MFLSFTIFSKNLELLGFLKNLFVIKLHIF